MSTNTKLSEVLTPGNFVRYTDADNAGPFEHEGTVVSFDIDAATFELNVPDVGTLTLDADESKLTLRTKQAAKKAPGKKKPVSKAPAKASAKAPAKKAKKPANKATKVVVAVEAVESTVEEVVTEPAPTAEAVDNGQIVRAPVDELFDDALFGAVEEIVEEIVRPVIEGEVAEEAIEGAVVVDETVAQVAEVVDPGSDVVAPAAKRNYNRIDGKTVAHQILTEFPDLRGKALLSLFMERTGTTKSSANSFLHQARRARRPAAEALVAAASIVPEDAEAIVAAAADAIEITE